MLVLVLQVLVFIIDSNIYAEALSIDYNNFIVNNDPLSDISNHIPPNWIDTNSYDYRNGYEDGALSLSRRWAPLVWLAPGEIYMPDSVNNFLTNMLAFDPTQNIVQRNGQLPSGIESQNWYLVPETPVDDLLKNKSSFLYGKNPLYFPVPTYVVIDRCHKLNALDDCVDKTLHFQVTYWFFYPYNQGKKLCFLGPLPIPQIFNKCLGETRTYGSHVGDWEHISLLFRGSTYPEQLYVSTHDAGAFYKYDINKNIFKYKSQETRNGVLQKPNFPPSVQIQDGRPILFSARGSHGMWSQPGSHRFIRLPKLVDTVGLGIPWETWKYLKFIEIPYLSSTWMYYQGHWGPPKSICHPIKKFGIDICEYNNGPVGIPLKTPHFTCPKNN